MLISGLYRNGRLYKPDDPSEVDPGRLAFGQERLIVTPLQMALVAAGVANDGVVMEPRLVQRITAPDGDVIERFGPEEWKTAIEPSTAAELTAMMTLVVESGTGTAAQIPGVSVAGKTGTAETGVGRPQQHVVHRVRARGCAEGRRGRRAHRPVRHRRRDGGAR